MTDEEIYEKVQQINRETINPSLGMHGGGAKIVKVEDGKVYVELLGGCKGCMGARMTMKGGIEKILREQIPEITEVIDATDHKH
ncbi:NifU family protein [Kiritimatiella glycovorans]|uniref:Fe/S biogenesis protein NfuA n=1 Tax=Kiritimatiella glycovorans TaxID=1307763 RepID=A0A0G3EI16_9BACT|nr:NifU family protein [Kiritimatiella glycovorans]AKJ65077.1 Fe/S biogenesis protein NfuA [Kiritimatiella glycovorans]